MRRGIAVAALLAVIALVAIVVIATMGSGGSTPTPATPKTTVRLQPAVGTIHGRSFSAAVPEGWRLTSATGPHGVTRYQLSSTGAPIDGLGLPPAGTIGLTIDELPAAAGSPAALLRRTVGTPRGAAGVQRAAAPRTTRLAGSPAAEEAYTYTYQGFSNVQVDVVGARAGRAYLIELDAEPSLGAESESALRRLFSSWRWR